MCDYKQGAWLLYAQCVLVERSRHSSFAFVCDSISAKSLHQSSPSPSPFLSSSSPPAPPLLAAIVSAGGGGTATPPESSDPALAKLDDGAHVTSRRSSPVIVMMIQTRRSFDSPSVHACVCILVCPPVTAPTSQTQ